MKFLLTLLLILLILAVPLYFIFQKNQVAPAQSVVTLAKSIPKYPNAGSWEIKTGKRFCLEFISDCQNSITILFASPNGWQDIYTYYKQSMADYNWSTKSLVYTSIPGSIVFTNQNCEADLSPTNNSAEYNFQITCSSKAPAQ